MYYQFFVVEADRSTEPLTSSNMNRKSLQRMLLQYEDYLGQGRYKEHLKLTAPMVVLCVFENEEKAAAGMNSCDGMKSETVLFGTVETGFKE